MMKNLFYSFLTLTLGLFAMPALQAQCVLNVPADLVLSTDPGVCFATIPAGVLLATQSADCLLTELNEDFNDCVQPAGWTTSTTGSATVGNGIFFNQFGAPGGFGPATFTGCVALIDDDFANNVGFSCIITPALDNTDPLGSLLTFSWQHEAFVGGGDTEVDVWDGAAWVRILTVQDDSDSAEDNGQATPDIPGDPETFDVTAQANAAFQVRFCYNDEGGFQWGMAFDNVVLTGIVPSPAVITNDSPFATAGDEDAAGLYLPGVYTITYETIGPAGPVFGTTNLTVADLEAPVFAGCPDDITFNLDPGACDQVFSFDITATENCNGGPLSIDQNVFAWPPALVPNGVVCTNATFDEVAYTRFFDLAGIVGLFTIETIDLGFQVANPAFPVTVTISSYNGAGFSFANLTTIATFDYVPTAGSNVLQNIAVPGMVAIPAGTQFAITVAATSVIAGGTIFALDPAGETDPTYVSGCAATLPGFFPDLTNLDLFFNNGLVIQLNGTTGQNPFPVIPDPANVYDSGDPFPIGGPYTLIYTATDDAGNVATCEFNVTVEEYPFATSSLNCNLGGIQVSLDPDCEATIGADDILEGGLYGCYDNYTVSLFYDANLLQAVPGSPVVTGANIGQTLWAMVTDPATGNSCWGTIFIEDKHIPDLECGNFELPCSMSTVPGTVIPAGTASPTLTDAGTWGNTAVTLDLPFGVNGLGTVTDVDVAVDISHTWVADLTVIVTSPSGTSVTVLSGQCFLDDDIDVVFDDESANVIACTGGTPALSGDMQPQNPLSAFDGEPAFGDWTVTVSDPVAFDGGTINSVTLTVAYTASTPVQFPVATPPATIFQTNAQRGTQEYTARNFDGCGDAILAYSDWIDDIDCLLDPANPYTKVIYRTWTATDGSGNATQCEDTIGLLRATLADLVTPPNWNDDPAENASLLCDEKEVEPANQFCGTVVGWNMIDAGDYPGRLVRRSPISIR